MINQSGAYNCKTCQNNVPKGQFCPSCGVYNQGEKSTLKGIFSNAVSEVFSVEKGLIHNFKATFLQPHDVVWSYFNGLRNKYATPGKFLLYTLFILGAIFYIDPQFGAVDIVVEGESANSLTATKIFIVCIIPFLTLTSKIVFWKNNGLAIHLISMVYIFLPRFVIASIVISILNFTVGQNWLQPLLVLILLAVTFWVNVKVQKNSPTILKLIGLTLLQYMAFLGLIVLLLGLGVVLGNIDFLVG